MSLNSVLNISKQGIFASQGALVTVSHNVSNLNTPGYSRQVVQQENVAGDSQKQGGSGVSIKGVTRNFDQLVDRRMELGTGELGRLETRDQYLTMIEDVFNDMDDTGFSKRLDAFFASADALADNPSNPVGREELVTEADALARKIQEMHSSLTELTMPLDKEVNVVIEDINTRLSALRDINAAIVANENISPALDLKDQRRNMVLELGKLIAIQTLPMAQDGLRVMTTLGQELLVDPVFAATLRRSDKTNEAGFRGIGIKNGQEFGDASKVRGGKLCGLLEIRDKVINGPKGVLTRLEAITDELRWQVNRVHSQSVSKAMATSQQGIISLGGDLDTAIKDVVTDPSSDGYKKSPVDLGRVEDGTITFVTGPSTNDLKIANTAEKPEVKITRKDSLRDIIDKINNTGYMKADRVPENGKEYLKISAREKGNVFGVLKDTSGILAALGISGVFGGSGAEDMAVSEGLLADSKLVGTARFNVGNENGVTKVTFDDANNLGLIALGKLRTDKFKIVIEDKNAKLPEEKEVYNENATLTGHYATLVGNLGSVIKQDKESLVAQKSAQDFISGVRESISGVSLEEELTDLIRYQRAFQASSKMVGVTDELLQTLISMV